MGHAKFLTLTVAYQKLSRLTDGVELFLEQKELREIFGNDLGSKTAHLELTFKKSAPISVQKKKEWRISCGGQRKQYKRNYLWCCKYF